MKYIAAFMLLTAGGNANPSAEDIKSVLSSVGIEADDERVNAVIAELGGKNIEELIQDGSSKLASVPAGGAAPAAGAAAGGSAAAAEEEAAPAEESESDEDMGMGLFD